LSRAIKFRIQRAQKPHPSDSRMTDATSIRLIFGNLIPPRDLIPMSVPVLFCNRACALRSSLSWKTQYATQTFL
jgi:hypothetical protein